MALTLGLVEYIFNIFKKKIVIFVFIIKRIKNNKHSYIFYDDEIDI